MKIITTILIFISYSSVYTQDQSILTNLDSGDYTSVSLALDKIKRDSLIEFTNVLEKRALEQPDYWTSFLFLYTLTHLNSKNSIPIIYSYINKIDKWESKFENKAQYKAKAVGLLLGLGDYSRVDLIFDYLEKNETNEILDYHLRDLLNIFKNVPEYRLRCIINTLTIFKNVKEYNANVHKYYALLYLQEMKYDNLNELCAVASIADEYADVRAQAIRILIEENYNGLTDILLKVTVSDSDLGLKETAASYLIFNCGQPEVIKTIKDLTFSGNYGSYNTYIQDKLNYFIPPRPTVTILDMIDTLISFTNLLFQYNWIKDSTNCKSYLTELKNQKKLYIQKDEDKLNDSIEHFLEMVEKHHKQELLTEEGYKYLHYYETYIKENVEDEF